MGEVWLIVSSFVVSASGVRIPNSVSHLFSQLPFAQVAVAVPKCPSKDKPRSFSYIVDYKLHLQLGCMVDFSASVGVCVCVCVWVCGYVCGCVCVCTSPTPPRHGPHGPHPGCSCASAQGLTLSSVQPALPFQTYLESSSFRAFLRTPAPVGPSPLRSAALWSPPLSEARRCFVRVLGPLVRP